MRSEEIRPSDDRVQEPLLNAKPQSRAIGQQSRECSFFSNALCPGPNAFPPPRFLCKLTRNIWSIWAAVRCRERHYGDLTAYSRSFDGARCLVMQGGQGDVKHWAFNDPPKREGEWKDQPPPPGTYLQLKTRITDLHPMTVIQNARTSGGGYVPQVPTRAATVGPFETWKADVVSIWHPGHHDNPFGIRLSALMISKRVPDTSVPMSLLADHPNVQFNFYRGGLGTCEIEMH